MINILRRLVSRWLIPLVLASTGVFMLASGVVDLTNLFAAVGSIACIVWGYNAFVNSRKQ